MVKSFVVVVSLCFAGSAYACGTAPEYTPELVGKLALDAPLIVEATLASATSRLSGHFVVHAWLKGTGPKEIDIGGFGYGSDCRSPMFKERSLFFLSRSNDGTYALRELQTYAGVRPPTKENIEAVTRAVASVTHEAK